MYDEHFMAPVDEWEALEFAEDTEPFQEDFLSEAEIADFDDLDMPEEDDSDLGEVSDEELDMFEDYLDLADALREGLSEEYADWPAEELEESLANVMDSLTPAESFHFAKALGQIGTSANQALADPRFRQIAGTALPLAGGVAGTALGGPVVGTAIGTAVGGAAASALPGGGVPGSTTAAAPGFKPSAAGAGPPAAAQGLLLMNNPAVQKAALAAAFGPHGQTQVNGVPVGAVMHALSTIFGEAAAEADEISYETSKTPAYMRDAQSVSADPAAPGDRARALYAALVRAEDPHLVEAVHWR